MRFGLFFPRTSALAAMLVLAVAAVAIAGVDKGASYKAHVTHAGGWNYAVTLRVAKDGKTASLSVQKPPIPCGVGLPVKSQVMKPGAIASSGAYKGSIIFKYSPEPSQPVKVSVTGKFSGSKFSGTFKNETGGECNWSTAMTART
jgi:hypothetical protein